MQRRPGHYAGTVKTMFAPNRLALMAILVLLGSSVPAPARNQAPAKPETAEAPGRPFARPWHISLPRPIMVAAWERLKKLDIPGVPLDQRFNIGGPAFYLSPDGDNAAEGSKEHPWRTLQYAVTKLKPGTVICLMAGIYYGPVEIGTRAGEQSPAALRALAGQEVVVTYDNAFVRQQKARIARLGKEGAVGADGKELHYPSLITIAGSYVEISGLHLVGVRNRLPMNLYSESGISIAGGGGMGCRVLDNEIENTGHCGVKEMGHGGSGFLIEGNYIHDLGQTAHDHAIYLPADNVTVRRNILLNTTGWGVHAYTEPKRLGISHNLIGGNAQDAVILGGSDCKVFNNIFYRNRQGGVFLFRRGCRNNTIVNNIILAPAAFRFDAAGSDAPADQPQGNVLDYNCINGGSGITSIFNPMGAHNIMGQPAFVDAARLDFRLQPGSPCIHAGDSKVMDHFYGQRPDIGIYGTILCANAPAGDWPQWGGSDSKNMASAEKDLPATFIPGEKDPVAGSVKMETTENVKWAVKLCQAIYSTPVVAHGKIFVGGRPAGTGAADVPGRETGALLWQWQGPARKVPTYINGWLIGIGPNPEMLGTCSSPIVDGEHVYFVTHSFKVVCLDVQGQRAGPGPGQARVIWEYDLWDQLGVFPCDAANGSPAINGDFLYVQTSNGVDRNMGPAKEKDRKVPAPDAPNLIVLEKKTGRLAATDAAPIAGHLLHGQWSSVSLGTVAGRRLVFYGGGDGLCYAFEAVTSVPEKPVKLKTVWSYDCIPAEYKSCGDWDPVSYYCLGDKRTKETLNRNDGTFVGMSEIIGTPVLYQNRIYVAIGRNPEHGRGRGALHCIERHPNGGRHPDGQALDLPGSGSDPFHGRHRRRSGLYLRCWRPPPLSGC